ncbi:FG-nucleoporin nsp1 [Teratosphaeriaceae sp. CCFEE 6253]|nr:FG-nucleoporin nsp1 [Teratosphaeriaceae sp. CCFEE 6253]
MHHSLADMIEEVNSASAKLSLSSGGGGQSQQQSKAEDPLTEIVRVLNSHLGQLQAIDEGAAALQQRVTVAQREAKGLDGGRGGVGEANSWVEGFGRSYLGRR